MSVWTLIRTYDTNLCPVSPNLINLMSVWTLISNVCVGGSQFSCDIPIKMARVDKVRVLLSNGSGCAATETVQSKMHCNLTIVETRGEVCVYVLWPLKISNHGIWKWDRREHTQFYAKYNHTSCKERFSENNLTKKIWKIYPQNLNTTRSIEIVPRGGPPISKLILMNYIGRPRSSWWILEVDLLLGGCMFDEF